MDHRRDNRDNRDVTEKLIKLNRVAKVVKGGRRFSFSALLVVGDRNGRVGYGFGKANDVSEAIRKGVDRAKKSMVQVPLKGATLPHRIQGEFKSAKVMMKPAAPGTGIIAGGPVRAVMEVSGVQDILSKSLGSQNALNIVKAIFEGFDRILDARTVAKNRGKSLKEMWGLIVKIRITLVKSPIGRKPAHRRTVAALGLKKMHRSVERERTDAIMGMVNSVSYLLRVEEIE